jgi:CRP/FNR family cyclic AMP-dependent transcriptional regulator
MTALLTEGCLKPHPFVDGCSCEFLNHLEEFAREVDFKAGETILREGDYADRFYLICEGSVSLESALNGSPAITLQTLGAGEVLGWSWLYAPYQWHFTARAITRCHAVELNAASLLVRAEEDPVFGYELMKRLSQHLIRRLQSTRKRLAQEVKMRNGSA